MKGTDVAAAQQGDRAAADRVVRSMLPKVREIAQHMCGDLEQDDMVQAGQLGVLRAMRDYDATKGASFRTYAKWWIRHYMQLERRKQAACGMTGLNARRAIHARKGSTAKAGGKAGKSKDPRWQAGGTGTACRTEAEAERLRERPDTLTPPLSALVIGAGGESEMVAAVDARAQQQDIANAVAELPVKARRILELRYSQDMSLREIGKELNCTAERVRQIERQALDSLREALG